MEGSVTLVVLVLVITNELTVDFAKAVALLVRLVSLVMGALRV